jgi:hypothetical protein
MPRPHTYSVKNAPAFQNGTRKKSSITDDAIILRVTNEWIKHGKQKPETDSEMEEFEDAVLCELMEEGINSDSMSFDEVMKILDE